jgi:hypothetical protein
MSAQVSVAAMVNFTENGKCSFLAKCVLCQPSLTSILPTAGVTSALMIPGGTKKISKASMAKLRAMGNYLSARVRLGSD